MRLIDADALIESIDYSFYNHERVRIDTVTGTFLSEYCSPTIEAEPVKRGLWKKVSEWMPIYNCSICGERNLFKNGDNVFSNYCPHCGAKMEVDNG